MIIVCLTVITNFNNIITYFFSIIIILISDFELSRDVSKHFQQIRNSLLSSLQTYYTNQTTENQTTASQTTENQTIIRTETKQTAVSRSSQTIVDVEAKQAFETKSNQTTLAKTPNQTSLSNSNQTTIETETNQTRKAVDEEFSNKIEAVEEISAMKEPRKIENLPVLAFKSETTPSRCWMDGGRLLLQLSLLNGFKSWSMDEIFFSGMAESVRIETVIPFILQMNGIIKQETENC